MINQNKIISALQMQVGRLEKELEERNCVRLNFPNSVSQKQYVVQENSMNNSSLSSNRVAIAILDLADGHIADCNLWFIRKFFQDVCITLSLSHSLLHSYREM